MLAKFDTTPYLHPQSLVNHPRCDTAFLPPEKFKKKFMKNTGPLPSEKTAISLWLG